MTPTVRQATVRDAPAIQDVARESWHAAYDEFLGAETVESIVDDWYDVDELAESITDATDRDDVAFLVVDVMDESEREPTPERDHGKEDERRPVGFVHVLPSQESTQKRVASLIRLYLRPTEWGRGIGTTLLERAVSTLADEYNRLRLEVFAENDTGVTFYESRGFDRVGEHHEEFAGTDYSVYTYEADFDLEL